MNRTQIAIVRKSGLKTKAFNVNFAGLAFSVFVILAFTSFENVYAVTVPDAPTSLTATAGDSQVSLSWTAPANTGSGPITDYIIQYLPPPHTGSWITFNDETSAATTATVTGLTNGQTYYFWVLAVNSEGASTPSVAVSAIYDVTVPDAPTSLTAIVGDSQVSLSWTAPANTGNRPITDYIIQYLPPPYTGSWITFNDETSAATTATLTGLTNGQTYPFWVLAVNSEGASTPSAAINTVPNETTSPTLTITTNPTSPSDSKTSLVYTFEFSEDVTGFTSSDITLNFAGVGAGAVDGSNFATTDANTYTLTLAGQDLTDLGALASSQTIVASVDMTGLTDIATNAGVGTIQNTWTYVAAGAWCNVSTCDENWTLRKKITIDNTKVSGSTALSDFPVLISLNNDADLKSSNVQSVGQDIRFTDNTGSILSHEIESFSNDATDGSLVAWVKVPTLSATADTVLYMYYGNSDASSIANSNAVWDSNYKAVYHLGETSGGTNAIKDSTSNANHGTDSGSPTFAQTAKVGNGVDFAGTAGNKIISSSNVGISGDGARTLEFWAELDSSTGSDAMVSLGVIGTNSLFTVLGFNSNLYLEGFGGGNDWNTGISVNTNMNHHFVIHSSGQTEWYVNGVRSGTGNSHTFATVDAPVTLGYRDFSTWHLDGILDEVRVSNVARSADWGTTSYNNQNSPSTFYSVGSTETSLIAINDSSTTLEDTAVTVSVLTNDIDGDSLSITSVTQGANGSVTFDSTSATYTPNSNFNGADSFTYTISDGNDGSDTATVNITVNAVDDNRSSLPDTTDVDLSNYSNTNGAIAITQNMVLETSNARLTIIGGTNMSEPEDNVLRIAISNKTATNLPANHDAGIIIEFGDPDRQVTFDQAVQLTLYDQAGKTAFYIDTLDITYTISSCDGSVIDSDTATTYINSISDSECSQDSGSDLIIWTNHFTAFGGSSVSSSGGGGSSSYNTPPSLTVGFAEDEFPLSINGNNFRVDQFESIMFPTLVQVGEQLEIKIRVFETLGSQDIVHADLYLNNDGKILNNLTETAIVYEKYGETRIQNPDEIISYASVTLSEEGNKTVFTFDVTFAKETDLSSLYFRIWDFQRSSVEAHVSLYDINDKDVLKQENVKSKNLVSFISPEMSKQQPIELRKQQEIIRVELVRDSLVVFERGSHNPYDDEVTDDIPIERIEYGPIKTASRQQETFQTMKIDQITIAEKKLQEIMGGKTITNSDFHDNTRKEVTNVTFEIGVDISNKQRYDEGFQEYKLEQIVLAEKVRDQILDFEVSGLLDPYERDETIIDNIQSENWIEVDESSQLRKIIFDRDHEMFQSHMDRQEEIARETLNKILDSKNIHNWQNLEGTSDTNYVEVY